MRRFTPHAVALAACLLFSSQASPQTSGASISRADEWVIYSTEVGWLRVGTLVEFEAKWKKKDEINGGNSEEPLKKDLLARGFTTRDESVKEVCDHLTKVQLRHAPPTGGGPARYLTGVFRKEEYQLRLSPGFDQEGTELMSRTGNFYKGLEYDSDAELAAVRSHGITPRHVFGRKQWLVHSLGHGSVDGPVKEDRWMCVSGQPATNDKGESWVELADGYGGTSTYGLKEVEGPFPDNYTLAKVMKKYKLQQVDLWPPVTSAVGRDVQPRVNADEIPDNPRDFGRAALPAQVIHTDPALQDWVIYSVEDRWLHLGTRVEFDKPVMEKEVLWGGTSEEPASKKLLAPPEGSRQQFFSRRQALAALVPFLSGISVSFDPSNQPRELVVATYNGKKYNLRLERGADPDYTVQYLSFAYDFGGNVRTLRETDKSITPRKTFKETWLVHATGHGTYSGPVKDDHWMMVTSKPDTEKGGFTVPDGMGGTFGYSADKIIGPFTNNYDLIAALRPLSKQDQRVKCVGLWGEDRGVCVADIPEGITPTDRGSAAKPSSPSLRKVTPASAKQNDTLGVTFLAKNVEPGCRVTLGNGLKVKDPTYFGRDAESDFHQWQATVEIDKDAALGKRTLTVFNPDGGSAALPDAFEVVEGGTPACPPVKLIVPAAARDRISRATTDDQIPNSISDPQERQRLIDKLRQQRDQFFAALVAMENGRDTADDYRKQIEPVVKDMARLAPQSDAKEYKDKLTTRIALESLQRESETEYAKGMLYLVDAFSEEEAKSFSHSLRERAVCLGERTGQAFDEMRKWNYVVYWEDWRTRQRLYDLNKRNLQHTLKLWQNFNSARVGKLDRLLGNLRHDQIVERGSVHDPSALRSTQRALRDTYLDMGLCGVLFTQSMVEDGIAAQDSYLASYKSTDRQAKNQEWAKEVRWQAEQTIVYSLKYAMSLGKDGFGSVVDTLKRFFNYSVGDIAGIPFSTVSSDTTKALDDSRKTCGRAQRVINRLRGYSDEQTIAFKQRDLSLGGTDFDPGLNFLANDLNFFTQTDGGLRRLAACYNTTAAEQIEDEYLLAIDQARRMAADMRKTANAFRGTENNDDFTNGRKLLTEPMQVAKTLTLGALFGGAY